MLDTGDTVNVEQCLPSRSLRSGGMGSGMETRKKLCWNTVRRRQSLGLDGGAEVKRREWTQVTC